MTQWWSDAGSFAARAAIVMAVFAGVGVAVGYAVSRHYGMQAAYSPEVRLASMMAGLFVGSAAAMVVALYLAFGRKR